VARERLTKGTQLFVEMPMVSVHLNITSSCHNPSFRSLNEMEMRILKLFPELKQRSHAIVLIIRFMNLLQESPSCYLHLFESYCSPSQRTKKYQNEIDQISQVIFTYYQHNYHQYLSLAHGCIDYVLRNTFTISDFELKPIGFGLFERASIFNHHCTPNTHHFFHPETGQITLRTNRQVSSGEELCISYIDLGQPTFYRRQELFLKYQFHCMCSRCSLVDSSDRWKCSQKKVIDPPYHCDTPLIACWIVPSVLRISFHLF
jgi:hypothetical protein